MTCKCGRTLPPKRRKCDQYKERDRRFSAFLKVRFVRYAALTRQEVADLTGEWPLRW